MQASDIPVKFNLPFANSAAAPYIRPIPTTSADPSVASLTLGFPPDTALPEGAGGTPPNIADFNGVLYPATGWARWQAAGAPVYWDSAFASAIGGYPKGATVSNLTTVGSYWLCLVENNPTNPDAGGANWLGYSVGTPTPLFGPPGTPFYWITSTPPTGTLVRDGSALSTTTYANLFAVTGYYYGGSGGTFNLPDDRGQFIRGWDDGAGIDPGRTFGDLQADAFAAHSHTITYYDNNSPVTGPGHGGNNPLSESTSSVGGTETRPKNRNYLPCIVY